MNCAAIIIDNIHNVAPIIAQHKQFLPDDWEVMHLAPEWIKSEADYNKFMTSREFWESLPFDWVLIFQHDSELLRTGIDGFLGYSYVGAPWKWQQYGGNGGLSLRNVKSMLSAINALPYHGAAVHGNEDVWFCNALNYLGMNLAPRIICEMFSVESIFHLGTLGAHAIDKYLTVEECKQIRGQYK